MQIPNRCSVHLHVAETKTQFATHLNTRDTQNNCEFLMPFSLCSFI